MRKDLLLELADFLDTLHPSKLDMNEWVCGTVRCAAGWGCSLPGWKEAGFYLNKGGTIRFIYFSSWKALEEGLGLTYCQSDYLFNSRYYESVPTPKEVADRIRWMAG